MMDIISNGYIKFDGKWYNRGEKIRDVDKAEVTRLVKLGVAKIDEVYIDRKISEKEAALEKARKKAESTHKKAEGKDPESEEVKASEEAAETVEEEEKAIAELKKVLEELK